MCDALVVGHMYIYICIYILLLFVTRQSPDRAVPSLVRLLHVLMVCGYMTNFLYDQRHIMMTCGPAASCVDGLRLYGEFQRLLNFQAKNPIHYISMYARATHVLHV